VTPAAPDELPLGAGTRVIADLHLDVERSAGLERFLGWLRARAGAPRLVVLGDLFEYWIGRAQAESAGGRRVLEALRERTGAGTPIDVVPGNRDFLLGAGFEARSGCRVRPAGLVGTLPDGRRVLLVHGDELATRDAAYQRLRRVLRAAPVRWSAEHAPFALTRAVARRLRRTSTRAVRGKASDVTELQPEACRALARRSAAALVVCGHAHRFRDVELEGGPRWVVLDAFGGERDELVVAADGSVEAVASGTGAA